ncbi:MAG: hypothetical protein K2X84_03190 [Beijerinckiaceae bacterium]|nr:hypothetical protein [Beijerinckiaceae bacterium]
MFERLLTRAKRLAEDAVLTAIARLAREAQLPDDVTVESHDTHLTLSGPRLRRRLLDDPRLRRIGR